VVSLSLCGRSILIVEDEPLIALDIVEALKPTGANVITAGRLSHALKLVESTDLSGVVLDYKIGDAETGSSARYSKSAGSRFSSTPGTTPCDVNGPTSS
jgi:DNA-binding response OmpR family regulator